MSLQCFNILLYAMSALALVVFIALFFVRAGYGIFLNHKWGWTINNKIGWVLMESPVFFVMLYLWYFSKVRFEIAPFIFFFIFEAHYFQRSFIFPLLMRGKGRMPVAVMSMGIIFNIVNGIIQGEWLFYLAPKDMYDNNWLSSGSFILGIIFFIVGMVINLHSDHVIRNLRAPGDNKHYLPQKGMYAYVTSANYFGELVEWVGFAIMTASPAAWVFLLWVFANLAPRASSIRKQYRSEFGEEAVGNRKCIIPFIF